MKITGQREIIAKKIDTESKASTNEQQNLASYLRSEFFDHKEIIYTFENKINKYTEQILTFSAGHILLVY